ncbi:molybdate ABC transporter ATP-binding protein ModF [Granulosicoccus antarcticus]|uniref:Putative ABC transporter ATP-binding protein YlmA n=1 Tax=Granulosicoccus antarcticus IMCC3135 TaxID=1192854 RepID=A0A2Z2NML3_9GAMM|nr:molybdate ABC transporter ATP-binding protein ModF [Granulosicoccus antarcticus]ASJ72702.1 putative ABC transporter ATP-binding protein YlmA [Granulosicoccus antarcticus IMCC3135]
MTDQSAIQLASLSVDFDERFRLIDIDWRIEPGQHWMITGTNGSGKSALAAALAGAGDLVSGSIDGLPCKVALVSYEAQGELIEAERRKDDADIMDVISEGTPVKEILFDGCMDHDLAAQLIEQFGLTALLERAFRKLSTGESRKVLLVRALTCKPELLILDEPFDGLDAATHRMLALHLQSLVGQVPMILVLNRFDECPEFITDIAYMDKGHLLHKVRRSDEQAYNELYQLLHLKTSALELPKVDPVSSLPPLDPTQPLVQLNEVSIRYGDISIFENLSWTIERNQHWQLTGPNGSGKTGLLSLITGDHPQCYVNDIVVFGFKRGSGESIWQIKQYIGYVSTALQWEYRVGTSLRHVIISGFYDSIGLYSKYTDRQREIADEWLAVLGMSDRASEPFNKLSYGDQRLLLIARSMVKHPPLLILDEPCLGLDDMNRQLVLALIEKICAGSETSVIYVNHHPEDAVAGIDQYLALGAA